MPPAAVAAAGRLAAYVRATSVDVPQVRLPRRSGRAPRLGSAAYGVPPARLDLATASFLRCALVRDEVLEAGLPAGADLVEPKVEQHPPLILDPEPVASGLSKNLERRRRPLAD